MVNQLLSNILWGQRGNFVSVPTDCPQRDERLGWTGGRADLRCPPPRTTPTSSAFFANWLRDVVDGADRRRRVPRRRAARHRSAGDGTPAWGDAGVDRAVDAVAHATATARAASATSPRCAAGSTTSAGTTPTCSGGTAPATTTATGCRSASRTPRDVLATAYFARSAEIVADGRRGARPTRRPRRTARCTPRSGRRSSTRTCDADGKRRGRHPDRLPAGAGVRAAAGRRSSTAAVEHLVADIEKRGDR